MGEWRSQGPVWQQEVDALMDHRRSHSGIEVRHARDCRSLRNGRCNCKPTYRANVWSNRDRKLIRKRFSSLAAAKAWRADAHGAVRSGAMRPPSPRSVAQAAELWLAGARDGTIRNRSGDRYKPSVIRTYEIALRRRIVPALGPYKLSDVRRTDVQDLVDELLAEGTHASTIRNTLMPLRAIYRRHIARGDIAVNPTAQLELPAVRTKKERIASPEEAARLIEALPAGDRAVWAAAMYAGLRLGELMALRREDADLAAGVIRIERSWDAVEGLIGPKSSTSRRKVPIPAALRDHLVEHLMSVGRERGLIFGRSADRPFNPQMLRRRADRAWREAELDRITLHEGRHTFASLMIAAGVNAKAISTYMGHASIEVTFDKYGHLMPGNEDEAAELLDAYLERANTAARLAAVE